MYLIIGFCLTLIIGTTSASNPLVRDDGKCGSSNPLGDGSPSQCNPGFCCSEFGNCGNTPAYCDCSTCVRYDNMESSGIKILLTYIISQFFIRIKILLTYYLFGKPKTSYFDS